MTSTNQSFNNIDSEKLDEYTSTLKVQRNLSNQAEENIDQIKDNLNELSEKNKDNSILWDEIINNIESLSDNNQLNISAVELDDAFKISEEEEIRITSDIEKFKLPHLETIEMNEDWTDFTQNIKNYMIENKLQFGTDPYEGLLTHTQKQDVLKQIDEDYKLEQGTCDSYDYFLASFSGIIGGIIDIFFVGSAEKNSKGSLSKWSDRSAENAVDKFYHFVRDNDKSPNVHKEKYTKLSDKVAYLERKFKAVYDAGSSSDLKVNNNLQMNTGNHHTISLGHSLGPEGLIFSIIDQFTGKGSYYSAGQFVRSETKPKVFKITLSKKRTIKISHQVKEKIRSTGTRDIRYMSDVSLIKKIFIGMTNWFGHCMSDLIGSKDTVEKGNRGSGLPIPFTQFFQSFDWVKVGDTDVAEIARKVFDEGYDLRHGIATAIPVVVTELITRFLWAVKQVYYHGKDLSDLFFGKKHADLRRMLLVSHGVVCFMDAGDALIRSGGELTITLLRMNLAAWTRLAFLGIQEIRVIYTTSYDLEKLDADLQDEWEFLYSQSS